MMLEQRRVQNLFQEKVVWFVVFAPKLYLFFSWVHSFFFSFFPVHRMGIVRERAGEFANGLVNFSNGLHTCSSTGTLHLH